MSVSVSVSVSHFTITPKQNSLGQYSNAIGSRGGRCACCVVCCADRAGAVAIGVIGIAKRVGANDVGQLDACRQCVRRLPRGWGHETVGAGFEAQKQSHQPPNHYGITGGFCKEIIKSTPSSMR